jgi:hypothetical protein
MIDGKYYEVSDANKMEDILEFYREHSSLEDRWVFRGLTNQSYDLKPTLEREMEKFGLDKSDAKEIERGLLRKFMRHSYHYLENPPPKNALLEWLALMRHYGAPTRLLDWSYSFFITLYFAVESVSNEPCAVWAIKTKALEKPFEKIISDSRNKKIIRAYKKDGSILKKETFRRIFFKSSLLTVGVVTPFYLNDRVIVQQGTFLCPGNVTEPFEKNLCALLDNYKDNPKSIVHKLIINCELKKDILRHLQGMNINRASIYPGLEGFATSLKTLLVAPKIFLDPGKDI